MFRAHDARSKKNLKNWEMSVWVYGISIVVMDYMGELDWLRVAEEYSEYGEVA